MFQRRPSLITLCILALTLALSSGFCRADEAALVAKEARLREALTNAYALLKTAQDDNAKLQAAQVESDHEVETLKTQIGTLTDQLKSESSKADQAAKDSAAQIEQMKADGAVLQRKVADASAKNIALYRVATEILDRYSKFSLGDAITAKEPFTSLTRVKLENYVQDYKDKIEAQRLGSPDAAASTAAAMAAPVPAASAPLTHVPAAAASETAPTRTTTTTSRTESGAITAPLSATSSDEK